jgi:hypothetical protein
MFHVLVNPVAHFAVGDGLFDHLQHLLMRDSGGFEPATIKTFSEIRLVVRMQSARVVQADFVHVTRQVRPAIHRFTRTAGINDFAHGQMIGGMSLGVNPAGEIREMT